MKVAFASCMYFASDAKQQVWEKLLAEAGDAQINALLLLGDQVYTGYGICDAIFKPQRRWPPQKFNQTLYKLYKDQYEVPSFRRLLDQLKATQAQLHAIWDDHDFGYNNSYGMDPAFGSLKGISRDLFTQFLQTCRNPVSPYPDMPPISNAPHPRGIEQLSIQLAPGVRLHMLDARYYADKPGGRMFGDQWNALRAALDQDKRDGYLSILANGRALSISGTLADQSWRQFSEYDELMAIAERNRNLLFLGGDIHRNQFVPHNGIYEVISSAAAQDSKENFGLLDITDDAVDVRLFMKSAGIRPSLETQVTIHRGPNGTIAGHTIVS